MEPKKRCGATSNCKLLIRKLTSDPYACLFTTQFFSKFLSELRMLELHMFFHGYDYISLEVSDKPLQTPCSLSKECRTNLFIVANNAVH
jgi:hypothetical protein